MWDDVFGCLSAGRYLSGLKAITSSKGKEPTISNWCCGLIWVRSGSSCGIEAAARNQMKTPDWELRINMCHGLLPDLLLAKDHNNSCFKQLIEQLHCVHCLSASRSKSVKTWEVKVFRHSASETSQHESRALEVKRPSVRMLLLE